jgi:hypothetical protein
MPKVRWSRVVIDKVAHAASRNAYRQHLPPTTPLAPQCPSLILCRNIAAAMQYVCKRYHVKPDGSNLVAKVKQADPHSPPTPFPSGRRICLGFGSKNRRIVSGRRRRCLDDPGFLRSDRGSRYPSNGGRHQPRPAIKITRKRSCRLSAVVSGSKEDQSPRLFPPKICIFTAL